MGLDITAYSDLRHIGVHEFDRDLNEGESGPWCYYDNHVQAMAYETFPRSFRGIPLLDSPQNGFLWGGCYEKTAETKTHPFHAGSYGGYNAWRDDLARQFNPAPRDRDGMYEPDPDLPFYELIWFADNEGSISSEAAVDLLADFRTNASAYNPSAGWMVERYADWTHAFELAADGGLVDFH